jgi:hypothetical protein
VPERRQEVDEPTARDYRSLGLRAPVQLRRHLHQDQRTERIRCEKERFTKNCILNIILIVRPAGQSGCQYSLFKTELNLTLDKVVNFS